MSELEPGTPVRCRGRLGHIARRHNDGWWVVRFDDATGDVRPKPGHELVNQEIVAYVGEIEVLR